jgi:hypothetical protein
MQLVEETCGQQLTNDGDGSAHRDIRCARLILQRGDGLDEVALQLLGVAPGELEILVRDDDLARIAEGLAHRGVLFAGGLAVGPGTGEAVVGLAAEQQCVGGGQLAVHGRAHFVVEVREVPILWVLDDAVERDEQTGGDFPHGNYSLIIVMRCCAI